ncbi:GNAT family N-acetyltransferase [Wukongibacter baidiensis]|uniref:GNAT family N-acetyltransferase n=1 Tax=Wukongibacter baidiensis TaxID=1723361 RepID=UPI003D7FE847
MLNIRVAEEKDKKNIYNLLNEEGYNSINLDSDKLHNSMVVSDGGEIIGYSAYNEIPNRNIAIIEVLLIKSEFQGQYLGDGLIKSVLNLADKRGITKVYVPANSKNSSFFKNAGLTKRVLDKANEISTYIEVNSGSDAVEAFEAVLPDFFNKACRSKR